jgi:DNA-binding MarR family transcriptional regulator
MTAPRTHLARLHGDLQEAQAALTGALQLPDHDIAATEALALALLESGPARTPGDLARLTGLSRGRITHLTDALAARGVISKDQDHVDRRRIILSVTADGHQAAIEARACVERVESVLSETLGIAGVDMLAQLLAGLKRLSPESQAQGEA